MKSYASIAVLLGSAITAFAVTAAAQTAGFPQRPVTLLVPYSPGTGVDIIARVAAQKLSDKWHQPVIVENKVGASGSIGSEVVARAPSDGQMLLVTSNPFTMNRGLYRNVPYDAIRDFEPIGLNATGALMLVAHPSAGVDSVADLLKLAKAHPGSIAYASPGLGTPHHMAMELLSLTAGIKLLHVPYKGTAGAVADTLGGQVQIMFMPVHVGLSHVKAGKLKALGIASLKRSSLAPDVPTLAESGIKGAEIELWYGALAPRGTSRELVNKLNNEFRGVLVQPDVRSAFAAQGLEVVSSTPEEFRTFLESDAARWLRVVKEAGISAE
jgi:tripartite-type tricarboxylate transporter receptor subunit TctC